jgi:hypothetical protein
MHLTSDLDFGAQDNRWSLSYSALPLLSPGTPEARRARMDPARRCASASESKPDVHGAKLNDCVCREPYVPRPACSEGLYVKPPTGRANRHGSAADRVDPARCRQSDGIRQEVGVTGAARNQNLQRNVNRRPIDAVPVSLMSGSYRHAIVSHKRFGLRALYPSRSKPPAASAQRDGTHAVPCTLAEFGAAASPAPAYP